MKKTILFAAAALGTLYAGTAFAAPNASSATADASSTIIQPVTIAKNNDLAFGRIVKPASGTGSVAIANTADSVNATGAVALSGITTSRAKFTISGEGGQSVSVSVPASVTMSNGADTLDVTLDGDLGTSTTLSGALGDTGTAALNVGGSFSLASTTKTGVYTGTFQVDVAYQ
jgi:hypothetical protein